MTTLTLHAQPYDTSARGFYFTSYEEYHEKFTHNLPVEEYEIQFIDGTDEELALSKIIDLTQCTIEEFFDRCDEDYNEEELIAIDYLVNNVGYSVEQAFDRFGEVQIYNGNINDWAYDQAEAYGLEGFALQYFDEAAFVNDCTCNGDIVELDYQIYVTNANEF